MTDPADPRLVGAIEGPDHAATWQVQVADGLLVQGMEHRPPAWGGDPALNSAEGIRFFDVSDPAAPNLVSEWHTGEHGVHRNHFTGGRYVHVTASRRGFEGNIYVILDIADPRSPKEVAMWFLPEQYVASGKTPPRRISLHGPPYVLGDRAYLSLRRRRAGHPRHLGHRAAGARLATGDRRRLLQHDRVAHRDPAAVAKPVAGQHRGDRGAPAGALQLRGHRRHRATSRTRG